MNSRDIDDSTACFLTEDQEVGIVVHEEEGEVLRLEGEDITFDQVAMLYYIQQNEPVSLSQVREEYDAGSRQVTKCLHRLFKRGELYEPQPNEIYVVPE